MQVNLPLPLPPFPTSLPSSLPLLLSSLMTLKNVCTGALKGANEEKFSSEGGEYQNSKDKIIKGEKIANDY